MKTTLLVASMAVTLGLVTGCSRDDSRTTPSTTTTPATMASSSAGYTNYTDPSASSMGGAVDSTMDSSSSADMTLQGTDAEGQAVQPAGDPE